MGILNKLGNAVKLVYKVIIVQEFNNTNRFGKCLTGTRGRRDNLNRTQYYVLEQMAEEAMKYGNKMKYT
jgi:hypothetical protein